MVLRWAVAKAFDVAFERALIAGGLCIALGCVVLLWVLGDDETVYYDYPAR